MWKQTIVASAPGVTSATFAQWYDYDGLNRLTTAYEAGLWYQPYSYDRWGNRVVPPTGQWPIYVPQPSLTPRDLNAHMDKQTNRVTLGSSLHDAAGNQKVDALGRKRALGMITRKLRPAEASNIGIRATKKHGYEAYLLQDPELDSWTVIGIDNDNRQHHRGRGALGDQPWESGCQ